jgi:uncharacterized protein (UPF0333 family)
MIYEAHKHFAMKAIWVENKMKKIRKFNLEKKGQSQMFWILMVAVIAIIVGVFIILWFKGSGSKAFGSIDDTIDTFGDCDKDDVANYFDDCPCDAGITEFDGCESAGIAQECEKKEIENCASCGAVSC